ncbi:hypothetical protein AGMMS50249_4140 [candidate division SR1 bacterium]|nr:hypothetical protein AGMMS50249_4140 [candidate division SR1 bacterium]
MKKISLLFLFGLVFTLGVQTRAVYTPSATETQQLAAIKNTLNTVSNSDLLGYYQQFASLAQQVAGHDEKLDYFLQNLRDYSYSQFSSQKNIAKQSARAGNADFVNELKDKLLIDGEISNSCLGYYNMIDNLSFANDFPTALSMAMRWRESTCGFVLPKNGDGPFQIVTKDYGTGEMTTQIFSQTLQDFFDFSKNKIQRYNNANSADGLAISLAYTGASLVDLLRFSALYNGLSGSTVYGDIQPAQPKYFREGYSNSIWTGEVKKDGILSTYIKALQWELKQ